MTSFRVLVWTSGGASSICSIMVRYTLAIPTNVLMIIIATAELYGGFMTFAPEWLTGNANLDGSNFMYLWVYLVFFNMLWVFIPAYAVYVSVLDINHAFEHRAVSHRQKKHK